MFLRAIRISQSDMPGGPDSLFQVGEPDEGVHHPLVVDDLADPGPDVWRDYFPVGSFAMIVGEEDVRELSRLGPLPVPGGCSPPGFLSQVEEGFEILAIEPLRSVDLDTRHAIYLELRHRHHYLSARP